MNLPCAQDKRFDKILKRLGKLAKGQWEKNRDHWGFLLIREPALIYAYNKVLKAHKKVYFKLLGETFQSIEGEASIN